MSDYFSGPAILISHPWRRGENWGNLKREESDDIASPTERVLPEHLFPPSPWFAPAEVAVDEIDEFEGVPGVPEVGASAASATNVVQVSTVPDGRGSPSVVVPSSRRLARGYLPFPKFRVSGWRVF
ncbi:hypothetical protein U1Q18_037339 [Sarracenia purpurea var. burkii]